MSAPFVVDASAIANWCFDDERTIEVETLFRSLALTYAEAPALLFYELQSLLRSAERRGRLTPAGINSFWEKLQKLDIRLDTAFSLSDEPGLIEMSRRFNLTVYDAAYLNLALRRNLPMATLDNELRSAALASGVGLIL